MSSIIYTIIMSGLIISIILMIISDKLIRLIYSEFSKYNCNISGKDISDMILSQNNIRGISVIKDKSLDVLGDCYESSNKTIKLSRYTYDNKSITSICIAAHECSHAIQDFEYMDLFKLRTSMSSYAIICSSISIPLMCIGFVFSIFSLRIIGILMFILLIIYSFITLLVEIDASKRALNILKSSNLFTNQEYIKAKIILFCAGLTYFTNLLFSIFMLLRLIIVPIINNNEEEKEKEN